MLLHECVGIAARAGGGWGVAGLESQPLGLVCKVGSGEKGSCSSVKATGKGWRLLLCPCYRTEKGAEAECLPLSPRVLSFWERGRDP